MHDKGVQSLLSRILDGPHYTACALHIINETQRMQVPSIMEVSAHYFVVIDNIPIVYINIMRHADDTISTIISNLELTT